MERTSYCQPPHPTSPQARGEGRTAKFQIAPSKPPPKRDSATERKSVSGEGLLVFDLATEADGKLTL